MGLNIVLLPSAIKKELGNGSARKRIDMVAMYVFLRCI